MVTEARSPRERLTERLRCIIAAQEWDGPLEVDDAEAVAADLIDSAGLADLLDEPRHIIDLRADGWTIKHPLSCRPNLFDCPVNRAAGPHYPAPPPQLGRFECDVDDAGGFVLGGAVR